MKKNKILKAVFSAMLAVTVVSSSAVVFATGTGEKSDKTVSVDETVNIETKTIFDSWVNYPNASFGYGYNAGWTYNSEEDYMNTTQNVGWTGFYNPDIDNLTTGKFSFKLKNLNFDPCGFTWGMKTGGTEEDPVYSFYAFEECDYYWSIAYISEWHPAKSGSSHQGPLYHGTIDADDYCYDHTGKDADCVGFAEGKVLAYGSRDTSLKEIFHDVTIDIQEDSVSVYINGELLSTVDAEVQAGSFGPFATSNPQAYFKDLKMISTNDVMLNPVFEYRNSADEAVNEAYQGDEITVADLSTFEGSEITDRYWTVTKDDEEIYTGSEPYTNYTDETGTYVTTLRLKNAYGITSDVYSNTLVVSKVPNVLTPVFTYMNGDNAVTEATTDDTVTINDECSFSGSPIKEHLWTVTKDGEEIYTGSEPYADYTSAVGEYVTSLVLTNEDGETSEPYALTLKVTEVEESSEESVEESSEESIEESSEESVEESSEESSEESVEESSEESVEESSESSVEESSVVSEISVTSNTESSVTTNNSVTNTGDNNSSALFSVLAVISALTAALVSVFAVQKKKQKNK
ncbi:MAG: hypothetical protein PUG48_02930 [Clostridia bacterium]|nr:hypothetical protein [Clostridia bacterium]